MLKVIRLSSLPCPFSAGKSALLIPLFKPTSPSSCSGPHPILHPAPVWDVAYSKPPGNSSLQGGLTWTGLWSAEEKEDWTTREDKARNRSESCKSASKGEKKHLPKYYFHLPLSFPLSISIPINQRPLFHRLFFPAPKHPSIRDT
jgi:hypothetical protein